MKDNYIDSDPAETQEWIDALDSVVRYCGKERATYLLQALYERQLPGSEFSSNRLNTPYKNTIAIKDESDLSEDLELLKQSAALIRWNALAMVLRGGKKFPELGGHIATYASAATLYDIGFNYFFRAPTKDHLGDLVFFQGHSAPGIYSRAFLEGTLSENELDNFRQESGEAKGLSSYPHPWCMPDFWQFPTVSMGLGPIQAIYQAKFLRYLNNRKLLAEKDRKVWAFLGDGEIDEPESLGAISVASRDNLNNLIFVVNCNLQRLDGPVRGNGKIIQELEGIFHGASWNVIKVIWGSRWDELLKKDKTGILLKRMGECVDGEYQHYKVRDGAYVRKHFFGKYPQLAELVADMSDEEIWKLKRGGHDYEKVHSAFRSASKHQGQPTVILVKTVKGFGLGAAGESQNITHQQKKMSLEHLKVFRDRFKLPISNKELEDCAYYKPENNSQVIKFLQNCRAKLGGNFPVRKTKSNPLSIPELNVFQQLLISSEDREISTTMMYVRFLGILMRDKEISSRIVPIVADESRTFGMEGMFRQFGIYSAVGQKYTPEDADKLLYYKESIDGQVLQEGITEAGAFCSWMAAATSYQVNQYPMIPFFIFYSMFGFQRIADLIWAAADMRARGFLLGATSGKTTLSGEGLQHTDGHSHLFATSVPNCRSYDPTFGYELAVILQHGLEEMYVKEKDVFYYVTVMNENYHHPAITDDCKDGIIKGMYLFKSKNIKSNLNVRLLGSGAILREVIAAAKCLENDFGVACEIWSVTSFTELKRDADHVNRHNLLHPEKDKVSSYVAQCLPSGEGPIVAATDYVRLYADQIRSEIVDPYWVLGTDGFGRSDIRSELRKYFEVDQNYIVIAALYSLMRLNKIDSKIVKSAMKKFNISGNKSSPFETD